MTGITTAGYSEPLDLVDGRGICRHQHIEFAESVGDGPTVEARNDLACIGVDVVDIADVSGLFNAIYWKFIERMDLRPPSAAA